MSFSYEPSLLLAAPGEGFEVVTKLSNHSWRFIPYVQMAEYLPECTTVNATGAVLDKEVVAGEIRHISKVYLMPRSHLLRRVPVSIEARGRHLFSGATLRGGDFLGLEENHKKFNVFSEVVVYPAPAEEDYIKEVTGGFIGDISVRRFIVEDPILTQGFREYTGREPMKSIAWQQSFHKPGGQLMVKNSDYTTELSVSVVLNIESKDKQQIEKCLSITHRVCLILEERRVKYDFFSNIVARGSNGNWAYISEGIGRAHIQRILEGLGRAAYHSAESCEALIARTLKTQSTKKSIIFITPGDEHFKEQETSLVISASKGEWHEFSA